MRMYQIFHADCFDWLRDCPPQTTSRGLHRPALRRCSNLPEKELSKLRDGRGGVWRLPPDHRRHQRDPLPRFTVLTDEEKLNLRAFFRDWGKLLLPCACAGRSCLRRRASHSATSRPGSDGRSRLRGAPGHHAAYTSAFVAATGPRMPSRNSRKFASRPRALTNRGCFSASRSAKRPWPKTSAVGKPVVAASLR